MPQRNRFTDERPPRRSRSYDESRPRPGRRRRRPTKNGPPVGTIIGVVVGVLCLVGGAGALVMFLKSDKDDDKEPTKAEKETKWELVESAEGRFRVRMPTKPQVKHRKMSVGRGTVNDVAYQIESDVSFQASFADFTGPVLMREDLQKIMVRGANAILRASPGSKLVVDKRITLGGGHVGRDFVIRTRKQGNLYLRYFAVGRRLYTLTCIGVKFALPEKDAERFLDSFELIEKK